MNPLFRDLSSGFVLDLQDGPSAGWPSIGQFSAAHQAMTEVEAGAVANIDEQRQVGHYWLRAPALAPDPAVQQRITDTWAKLRDPRLVASSFTEVLLVGIGGSALGPMFLDAALATSTDPRRLHCMDNTDPEGIARLLRDLDLAHTLVLVVSKSGGTPETRNGMLATQAAFANIGLPFHQHAIAVTGEGSVLDKEAKNPEAPWLAVFPIPDWVGGRTSVTGPVGLLPMALCGWDWEQFVRGAAQMDVLTRNPIPAENPAALLAGAWYAAGNGRGDRSLVILPYRDRFSLLGRYLQQLIMESIGKWADRNQVKVQQGLTVYGNKGSTDQHAFVQQVRDGRDDTFVHFVETTTGGPRIPVDDGLFADDHLLGFLLGTRAALRERERPTVTLRVRDASAESLGMLVALFERAVGYYAELVNINAYHQPGVEAGKRAAKDALTTLQQLHIRLTDVPQSVSELCPPGCRLSNAARLLEHLAATGRAIVHHNDTDPLQDRYQRCLPG